LICCIIDALRRFALPSFSLPLTPVAYAAAAIDAFTLPFDAVDIFTPDAESHGEMLLIIFAAAAAALMPCFLMMMTIYFRFAATTPPLLRHAAVRYD